MAPQGKGYADEDMDGSSKDGYEEVIQPTNATYMIAYSHKFVPTSNPCPLP